MPDRKFSVVDHEAEDICLLFLIKILAAFGVLLICYPQSYRFKYEMISQNQGMMSSFISESMTTSIFAVLY